jgi:hypothetical protein
MGCIRQGRCVQTQAEEPEGKRKRLGSGLPLIAPKYTLKTGRTALNIALRKMRHYPAALTEAETIAAEPVLFISQISVIIQIVT